MTADVAMAEPQRLAGGAARRVVRGDLAASTPFYDHLMSMIDETALENRRVQEGVEIDVAPRAAEPRWRIGHLATCTAGLVVVVAVGSAIIGAVVGLREPRVVASDGPPPDKRPHVVAGAARAEGTVARPLLAADAGGARPVGIKVEGTAEGGIVTGSVVVAPKPEEPPVTKAPDEPPVATKPDEPAMTKPAGEPPMEKVDAGKEAGKGIGTDGPADGPVSTKAADTDVIAPAEDPPAAKAVADAPLSPTPQSKAETTVASAITIRIARIVSDANMRAGPSNGQPVVATLSRGSAVEVIECRAWCEVIFGGQRGWVYKGFIGASESPHGR